jgi:uncharacterized lipoprotein YmbA
MSDANRTARIAIAMLAWVTIAPACFGKTEVRYYTLASSGAPAGAARREAVRYTVHVAPASVPEALDRPELVLRVSDTELAVDDNHRWAEPLRTGVARAVADSLARALDGALVSTSEQRTTQPASDVELTIDVQRLEVSLAAGAAIDVAWTARWANDGATRAGRSVARVPSAPGRGHAAAVAACAAALDAVGGDIAGSLRLEYFSRR